MALTKIKTGSVSDSITLTTPDINGGTIDATLIGGTTPAAISGTTGTFSSTVRATGTTVTSAPSATLSFSGTTSRLESRGADVSTRGAIQLMQATSNGSSEIVALGFDAAGAATFNSTIANKGAIFDYNTSLYQEDSAISSYAADNGLYINGNSAGYLALRGDGSGKQNITLYGDTSGVDAIYMYTNAALTLRLAGNGDFYTTPRTGGHAVFNENGVDADFRVESDNSTHALFVQGNDGKVGVLNAAPRSTLEVGSPNAKHGIQLNGGPNGVATQIHMIDGKSGAFTTLTIDVQLNGAGGYFYQVQVAGTAGCKFQTGGGYTNGSSNFSHSVGTGSGFSVTSPSNNLIRLVAQSGVGTHPACEIKMTQALNANHDQDNVTITWSS